MFLYGGHAPGGLGGPRHAGRLQEQDPLGSAHTQVRSPESAVFSLLTGCSLTTVRPSVAEIKSQRYGLHLCAAGSHQRYEDTPHAETHGSGRVSAAVRKLLLCWSRFRSLSSLSLECELCVFIFLLSANVTVPDISLYALTICSVAGETA